MSGRIPWPITTSVIAIHRALSHSGTRRFLAGVVACGLVCIVPFNRTRPRGCLGSALGALRHRSCATMGRMDVLRAVVTGASSGIGEATVRAFRAAGWDVVGVARREDRLRALAEETGASVFVADLTDQADVDALRDHLAADRPGARARQQRGRRERPRLGRGVRRSRTGPGCSRSTCSP